MAIRIHTGMIDFHNWSKICDTVLEEYGALYHMTTWFEKHYQIIEIRNDGNMPEAGDFRILEFQNKEKYTEFCLQWM